MLCHTQVNPDNVLPAEFEDVDSKCDDQRDDDDAQDDNDDDEGVTWNCNRKPRGYVNAKPIHPRIQHS